MPRNSKNYHAHRTNRTNYHKYQSSPVNKELTKFFPMLPVMVSAGALAHVISGPLVLVSHGWSSMVRVAFPVQLNTDLIESIWAIIDH